jgi:hypothetical protein
MRGGDETVSVRSMRPKVRTTPIAFGVRDESTRIASKWTKIDLTMLGKLREI